MGKKLSRIMKSQNQSLRPERLKNEECYPDSGQLLMGEQDNLRVEAADRSRSSTDVNEHSSDKDVSQSSDAGLSVVLSYLSNLLINLRRGIGQQTSETHALTEASSEVTVSTAENAALANTDNSAHHSYNNMIPVTPPGASQLLYPPTPSLATSTASERQNSTNLSTQQPILATNYPGHYQQDGLKRNQNIKGKICLATLTDLGGYVYIDCTSICSWLCIRDDMSAITPAFYTLLSGVTAIAQGFNYVFVLCQTYSRTQCIRYNMQLKEKIVLFSDSDGSLCLASLTISDSKLLTTMNYKFNQLKLRRYNFLGACVDSILMPMMEKPGIVISLKENCFLLHTAQRHVRKYTLDSGRPIHQWKLASYVFQCVTADEHGSIYGIAQQPCPSSLTGTLCLIQLDKFGTVLTMQPILGLDTSDRFYIKRISVRVGCMILESSTKGLYYLYLQQQ